jgi:hypothetical protein
MTIALERLIAELEEDGRLEHPDGVRRRLEALDRLDAYLVNGEMPVEGARPEETAVYRRAGILSSKLELANRKLYETIRSEIQRKAGADTLLRWANEWGWDTYAPGGVKGESYDWLDELISGVLQVREPDAETSRLDAEMVFYQPTPARHIFDMIRRTALNERDVLVDLGSGLGHVPLMAAICTGARTIGIECEAVYVECARQSADALRLDNVKFIEQDAREADLSSGTAFFLYTPFAGSILRSVLELLRKEAAGRKIRVCTFGPCTRVVAEERWLETADKPEPERVAIFCSRN